MIPRRRHLGELLVSLRHSQFSTQSRHRKKGRPTGRQPLPVSAFLSTESLRMLDKPGGRFIYTYLPAITSSCRNLATYHVRRARKGHLGMTAALSTQLLVGLRRKNR